MASSNLFEMAVPALFTSSPPNALTVFSTALLTASRSPAFARIAMAFSAALLDRFDDGRST